MFPEAFTTARLLLRPIQPTDARAIFDTYAKDPHVTRFLTWRAHRNLRETEAYVAHCLATAPSVARTYVILDQRTRRIQGALDLRHASPHRVEFGYWLVHPNISDEPRDCISFARVR